MTINKKCFYSGGDVKPEHSFMIFGHCSAAHRKKTMRIIGAVIAVIVVAAVLFGQGA